MRHLSLLALLGCTGEVPAPTVDGERTITVVYSNNLDGEVEPCG